MFGVGMSGAGGPLAVGSADAEVVVALREAVLAGPACGAAVSDGLADRVLGLLADPVQIASALAACGFSDRRRRALPGEVTVAVVLGLCLFSGEGYDSVLARVVPRLPGALAPCSAVPTGSALSQARDRLAGAGEPLRVLFEQTAGLPEPVTEGSRAFGLELTAFDGTVADLAATAAVAAEFTTPAGGRYPQARVVTLVTCGTRRVRAAALGSSGVSEQALVDQLADALGPGTLNLADRNFFSLARWVRFSATGAQLAWRVKNGAKSLPAKVMTVLTDGSVLVRLRESASMLARRRSAAGDPTLPRLPDTIARLVEFDVTVTDGHGRARRSRFRVLTTLLDHRAYPAAQIAAVYAQRWQVEVVYYRIKVTLRGPGVVLRGQNPALARQEIWGLLVIYNALCDLATRTAVSLALDPDEISFVAVLRLTRAQLGTSGTDCGRCGHRPGDDADPIDTLVAAIAAHPRNRTGRQRASPRTKTQRRTEHTRRVTYTISIVTSNLPRTD
jgi:hypothetical protein